MKLCSRNHPQTPENTRTTRHAISGVVYVTCVACVREKKLEAKKMQRARRRGGTPAPAPHLEWPAERIEELRGLWAQSELSTAAIARCMKTTKNAIVGKAHRLGLPGRPSPIIRDGVPKPTPAARAPKVTLPPLPSAHHDADKSAKAAKAAPPKLPSDFQRQQRAKAIAAPAAASLRSIEAAQDARDQFGADETVDLMPLWKAPPVKIRGAGSCCWLDGERGAYRRCDSPAVRGSYCERHGSLAYQPKQPSREMSHAV